MRDPKIRLYGKSKKSAIYVKYCDRCGLLFKSKIKTKYCLCCLNLRTLTDFKKYKETFIGYIID